MRWYVKSALTGVALFALGCSPDAVEQVSTDELEIRPELPKPGKIEHAYCLYGEQDSTYTITGLEPATVRSNGEKHVDFTVTECDRNDLVGILHSHPSSPSHPQSNCALSRSDAETLEDSMFKLFVVACERGYKAFEDDRNY